MKNLKGGDTMNTKIQNELEQHGYAYAVAFATQAEIQAGAACGMLAIIAEQE